MAFCGNLFVGFIIVNFLRALMERKSPNLTGTFKIITSLTSGTYLISLDDHKGKPIGSLIHYLAENLYDYRINDDGKPFTHGHVEIVSKNEANYINHNGTKTAQLNLNDGQLLIFNDARMKEYRMVK